jgi:DNA-binding response OmpR family regulator
MSDISTHTQQKRLLVIDDDPHMAELIARVARKSGYEARPLMQTLGLAQTMLTWRPHVITLDLKMPRANGTDVLSLLKVMGYDGQIVIISGMHSTQLHAARRQAETGGLKVAAEMLKPVDLTILGELLQQLRAAAPRAA